MSTSKVTVRRDGPLAIMTVSAPPLNLWDGALRDDLVAALDTLEADPPRGLLFCAEGTVWTAGVDVNEFDRLTPETGAALWGDLFVVMHRLENLPYPTVFAAHALCLTWGLEMALACDLLVAAEAASFGLIETVVGITPSMGGPQRLAERAGSARAREIVYTAERFSASQFEAWNIVNRVWPDEGFADRAREFAAALAHGPTRAHAATKQIVREQITAGTRAADAITPRVSGALFGTNDTRAAIAGFLAHGPRHETTFEGR